MKKTLVTLGLLAMTTVSVWAQMAARPDKDGVYPSGGKGLTLARLIHGAGVFYPSDPSLAAIKHVCVVRAVIGADGVPGTVHVLNLKANPFDDAAFAAIKQSKFEPGSLEGSTVPTYITLWVQFNVVQGAAPVVATPWQKGVSAPVALNTVDPIYPRGTGGEKLSGVVLIHLLVSEAGLPTDARVVWPVGSEGDENALEAVKKYRFRPATLYGIPVPFDITVEVNFRP